jgi:hypothetical protein
MPADTAALIHVGYQKAASTWLQHDVFPIVPDVEVLTGTNLTLALLELKWNRQWDADPTRSLFVGETGRTVLLSDENLCGDAWRRVDNLERNLDRLAEVYPDGARVLALVRRQQDALVSLHAQYVRMGGAADIEQFATSDTRPGYDPDHLRYDRLCDAIVDRFGPRSLTVVPMELLRTDLPRFWGALSAWSGSSVRPDGIEHEPRNTRESADDLRRMRVWNRYVRRSEFSPRGLLRDRVFDEATAFAGPDEFEAWSGSRRHERPSIESSGRRRFMTMTRKLGVLGEGGAGESLAVERHLETFRSSNRALQRHCAEPLEPLGYLV